ncbi:hypothetical protein ACWEGE_38605 [Amycolatopsis sp. NPDC004747]
MAREIAEETGLSVYAAEIPDASVYHIAVANKDVFIVTYGSPPPRPRRPS